ncbi:hypothetical protein PMZ80_002811 [Knufia obscura]|uniref:DUF6590 domain-containing protein n=1 Tax=Knufia obscura TaxID=1635080 RepID=A0ABR0RYE6_9EURO|nr:hypothetical protein PMZ80_002811 [Knufia obscura]
MPADTPDRHRRQQPGAVPQQQDQPLPTQRERAPVSAQALPRRADAEVVVAGTGQPRDSRAAPLRTSVPAGARNLATRPIGETVEAVDDTQEESDDDDDYEEFPFSPQIGSGLQRLVKCRSTDERVDFIEADSDLWREDKEAERTLLRESIRFERMGKSDSSKNCRHSLALLQITWGQRQTNLENGRFFVHLKRTGTREKRDFNDRASALRSTVEDQAEAHGPLAIPARPRRRRLSIARSAPTERTVSSTLRATNAPDPAIPESLADQQHQNRRFANQAGFSAGTVIVQSGRNTIPFSYRLLPSTLHQPPTTGPRPLAAIGEPPLQVSDVPPVGPRRSSSRINATSDNATAIARPINTANTLNALTREFPNNELDVVDPEAIVDPITRNNWKQAYKLRSPDFFTSGKVFAILWPEPAGSSTGRAASARSQASARGKNFVLGPRGEEIYVHPRRMVVITTRHGYCWCVSVTTYSGRALLKPGLSREDINSHAIIYDSTKKPKRIRLDGQDEPRTIKRPIAVQMTGSDETLDVASRIPLGEPSTVKYNVKVMDIGQVTAEDLQVLIANVKEELKI